MFCSVGLIHFKGMGSFGQLLYLTLNQFKKQSNHSNQAWIGTEWGGLSQGSTKIKDQSFAGPFYIFTGTERNIRKNTFPLNSIYCIHFFFVSGKMWRCLVLMNELG